MEAFQSSCDAIFLVDVLSFSTVGDIALSNGAFVLPYRWKDDSAGSFAVDKDAVLADRRGAGAKYTLSP